MSTNSSLRDVFIFKYFFAQQINHLIQFCAHAAQTSQASTTFHGSLRVLQLLENPRSSQILAPKWRSSLKNSKKSFLVVSILSLFRLLVLGLSTTVQQCEFWEKIFPKRFNWGEAVPISKETRLILVLELGKFELFRLLMKDYLTLLRQRLRLDVLNVKWTASFRKTAFKITFSARRCLRKVHLGFR